MIFVGGIEFDFVLVLGSKVTCFWCGGSESTAYEPKLACFECDDRLTCFFIFVCGWWWSKWSRFLDAGRKSLGFSVRIEIDLVVWVVDIYLISVWGIELSLISV